MKIAKTSIYKYLCAGIFIVGALFLSGVVKAYNTDFWADPSCYSGYGCHKYDACGYGSDGCSSAFGCTGSNPPACGNPLGCSGATVYSPSQNACITPTCSGAAGIHCPGIGYTCHEDPNDPAYNYCTTATSGLCTNTCGDGIWEMGCESCDDGPNNQWCTSGGPSSVCTPTCYRQTCSSGSCGDGTCNNNEDPVSCPADCSAPPVSSAPCSVAPGTNKMTGCVYNDKNLSNYRAPAPEGPAVSNPADSNAVALNFSNLADTQGRYTNCGYRTDDGGATWYWACDWENVCVSPAGLCENYSILWRGNFTFSGGTYQFDAPDMDDGYRVYIDGTVIGSDLTELNQWRDQCCNWNPHTAQRTLSAGQHEIKVEWYQSTGNARVRLNWNRIAGLPTATLTGTSWATWAGNTRDTVWANNNVPTSMVVYAGANFALNWSSANTTSCTINGTSVSPASGGMHNVYTAGGGGWRQTYTLNCTGPGGSATDTFTVSVPPNPSNLSTFCSPNGQTYTASWTRPGGYNWTYVRLYDNTDGVYHSITQGEFTGTSFSVPSMPGHSYTLWIHNEDPNTAWSDAIYGTPNPLVCPNPPPTVTLSVAPSSVTAGSSATLSWAVTNATSCSNAANMPAGNWNTASNGSTSVNPVATTTYTLSCTGPGGTTSGSATLSVTPGNPNGGPGGTITSSNNTCGRIDLSWTAGAGATAYNVYRHTTNNSAAATAIASNLSALSFTDTNVTAGTAYYYWVESVGGSTRVPGSIQPITPKACSPVTSTITVTNSGLCESARITWTASAGATSYFLYRNSSNTLTGATKTNVGNVTTYTDPNVPVSGTSQNYYYWVSASNAGGEDTPNQASAMPIAVAACLGNLSSSDKDIASVTDAANRTTATGAGDCNGFNLPPAATVIKSGYTVAFTINLCNSSPFQDITNVVVQDQLTNLAKPSGGWQAQYQDSAGAWQPFPLANIAENLSDPNNPSLTFTFPAGFKVPKATSGTQVRKLTFKATAAPISGNVSTARFRNQAIISYDAKSGVAGAPVNAATAYVLYYNNNINVPEREEIQPQ